MMVSRMTVSRMPDLKMIVSRVTVRRMTVSKMTFSRIYGSVCCLIAIAGQYYKHVMIVIDDSSVVNK
jgi:hypothetical protein